MWRVPVNICKILPNDKELWFCVRNISIWVRFMKQNVKIVSRENFGWNILFNICQRQHLTYSKCLGYVYNFRIFYICFLYFFSIFFWGRYHFSVILYHQDVSANIFVSESYLNMSPVLANKEFIWITCFWQSDSVIHICTWLVYIYSFIFVNYQKCPICLIGVPGNTHLSAMTSLIMF